MFNTFYVFNLYYYTLPKFVFCNILNPLFSLVFMCYYIFIISFFSVLMLNSYAQISVVIDFL